MRRRSWCAVLVSVAVVLVALPGCQPGPARPFPQHVRYSGGGLRVTSYTQAQQDQDVRRFYDHWKAEYLVKVGDRYRVAMAGRNTPATAEMRGKTTSESMGYGMMIVALMAGYDPNARAIFDGLWRFTKTNPSDIDPRLMGFLVPPDPDANNSAFDGDVDMAYGLLLADDQWGSTSGPINYRAQAKVVLAGAYASTVGPQSKLPELGDWVDSTGTGQYDQYTPRPSDFMPAHFRAFARITGNAGWNTVAATTVSAVGSLQANHAPVTGLLPDFTVPVSATDHTLRPAPPDFLEGPNDDAYSYNSMRVPWRLATDALLNNSTTVRAQVTKMSTWIRTKTGGNPGNIKAGYELDGTVSAGADYFSTGFAAPFAVAAMTAPRTTANQAWLNALYAKVRTTHEDYFEDSVTLLSLLVITGNYWDPSA
jgi:endo-1,4-beta-D-glucanase Y